MIRLTRYDSIIRSLVELIDCQRPTDIDFSSPPRLSIDANDVLPSVADAVLLSHPPTILTAAIAIPYITAVGKRESQGSEQKHLYRALSIDHGLGLHVPRRCQADTFAVVHTWQHDSTATKAGRELY